MRLSRAQERALSKACSTGLVRVSEAPREAIGRPGWDSRDVIHRLIRMKALAPAEHFNTFRPTELGRATLRARVLSRKVKELRND